MQTMIMFRGAVDAMVASAALETEHAGQIQSCGERITIDFLSAPCPAFAKLRRFPCGSGVALPSFERQLRVVLRRDFRI